MRFLSALVAAFLLLVPAGCASAAGREADQLRLVAEKALDQIDPHHHVTVVVPDSFPENVRRVVSELRPTIRQSEVPENEDQSLPEKHLLLDEVRVDQDQARFRAVLGPVPKPRPGQILLACGTRYFLTLRRNEEGVWDVAETAMAEC